MPLHPVPLINSLPHRFLPTQQLCHPWHGQQIFNRLGRDEAELGNMNNLSSSSQNELKP